MLKITLSLFVAVLLLVVEPGPGPVAQANTPEFPPSSHQHAEEQAPSASVGRIPGGALPTVLDAISENISEDWHWRSVTGNRTDHRATYQATNANQQQIWQVDDLSAVLVVRDDAQTEYSLQFSLVGYGTEDNVQPTGSLLDTRFPRKNQLRRFYAEGLEEWFVNSPLGLEHGFTLNQPPAGSDSQAVVVLALAVSGDLAPQLDTDALGVSFRTAQGEALLGYRGLVAYDVTGRHLPVTLQQEDSQIHMRVDVAGARYPVTVDPLFQTESKLDAGGSKQGAAYFGWSVAVDGDWMAVGAPYEDFNGFSNAGAVYLFRRSGLSWSLFVRKAADSPESGAQFGQAVALSGNTLAVGAQYKDRVSITTLTNAGAVYVFDYGRYCSLGSFTFYCWDQRAELGAGSANDDASDYFGSSVAIEGDTLVVGAYQDEAYNSAINDTGAVYVFNRSAGSWNGGTQLGLPAGSASGDNVGYSVAISGSFIAVGARLDDAGGVNAGAVYVYTGSGSSWTGEDTVQGGAAGDQLGYSVDIDGTRMIAGAPYADPGGIGSAGAAYIYRRLRNRIPPFNYYWSELTTLAPLQADNSTADASVSDYFGRSVAIDLDSGGEGTGYALVSAAYNDDNGGESGSAYLYADNGSGSSWSQIKKLTALDAAASEYYGYSSVDVDAKTVVIGAPYEDDAGLINNGAAYVVGTQADSYLTLDLDQHAILRSGAINATAQLVVGGVSAPDAALSGLQISLLVCDEKNPGCDTPYKVLSGITDDQGRVAFTPLYGEANPGPGYFRVVARLTDTVPDYWEYPAEASDTIVVQQNSGYAVIIEGATVDPENNGELSHNKTANRIYETLLQRGFTDDRIFYFNQQVGDPDRPGVDTHTDISQLDHLLLSDPGSLRNYLLEVPGPLHFFMISHGDRDPVDGSGRFILNPGDGVTPREMPSKDINTILDVLQAVPGMENWPVAITIATCFSGAHIPEVSSLMGRGRVVVTSTMDDQQGYKGPPEPDRIRGGSFFAEEFLLELEKDFSYKEAFRNAADRTEAYTQQDDAVDSLAGQYIDNAMQNPLLDDSGDTAGTNNLSDAVGADGSIARDVYLGVGAWQPGPDYTVTETLYLPAPDAVELVLTDLKEGIGSVDVVIRRPGTRLVDDHNSEQSEAGYIHATMTRTGNVFTLPFDFQSPGKWEIWYYPTGSQADPNSGKIGAVRYGVVYVSDGGPGPGAFNLIKPANLEAHAKTRQMFDWEQSVDLSAGSNGPDAVTYKLLIAQSSAVTDGVLNAPLFTRGEIYWSLYYLGDPVLEDATTYYWQVIAIDSFGNQTPSAIWSFTTDDTNLVGGPLVGHVQDSSTSLGIENALVSVTPTAAYSQEGGVFIVTDGVAGPNTASASKLTYQDVTVPVVLSYDPRVSTEENFSLLQDAPDFDGDGIVDSVDNCPTVGNTSQTDTDNDGQGDACDPDDDNDGTEDALDCAPLDPAGEIRLTTGACVVDDADDDNDGTPDVNDAFPLDPGEQVDTDGDGTGDNADPDADNDGVLNGVDIAPLDPFSCSDDDSDLCDDCTYATYAPANDGPDYNNDGICDVSDPPPVSADGDLNVDGVVDVRDVLLAQRILLGYVDIASDPNYLPHGDVAPQGPPVGDGIFDLGDVLLIQRKALDPGLF